MAKCKYVPSIYSLISQLRKMVCHWFWWIKDMIRRLTTEIKECKQEKCKGDTRVVFERFILNLSIHRMRQSPSLCDSCLKLLWFYFWRAHARTQSTLSFNITSSSDTFQPNSRTAESTLFLIIFYLCTLIFDNLCGAQYLSLSKVNATFRSDVKNWTIAECWSVDFHV